MLISPPAGIWHGVWTPDPALDGNLASVTAFEALAGKPVAIVHFWHDWYGHGTIDRAVLDRVAAHGSLPMITWCPVDWEGGHRFDAAGILAGRYDPYLRAQARTLSDFGKPVFVRFMHEMNGTWYQWGVGHTDGPTYIAVWSYVRNLVQAIAPNTCWVWCVNYYNPDWGDAIPDPYYPGNANVDWVGMDCYNNGNPNYASFHDLAVYAYGQLTNAGKPIMVAEWSAAEPTPQQAAAGAKKGSWLMAAVAAVHAAFPKVAALVFFNENKTGIEAGGVDWTLGSSADAAAGYKAAVAAPYVLGSIGQQPPPPPSSTAVHLAPGGSVTVDTTAPGLTLTPGSATSVTITAKGAAGS